MKQGLIDFIERIKQSNEIVKKHCNEINQILSDCSDEKSKKVVELNTVMLASSLLNETIFLGVDTCIKNIKDKPGKKVW